AATDEPLQGAEFKITTVQGVAVDSNEGPTSSNGLYTTDAQGEIVIAKLLPGTYTVAETKAPNGYAIDRTSQTVDVHENDSQTLTFRDEPLQTLTLIKYEDGTTNPIAGVVFSVTDANGAPIGSGTYTTDADGRITIPGLAPGATIVAREIRTAQGYVLNGEPQTIQISAGGATGTGNTLVFFDSPLSTLLLHVYIDGTENEPLSNVGFKVVDGGEQPLGANDGVYYSDHTGTVTLTGLEPGVTINARIFKIADGCVLDGLPQEIVTESGAVQELIFWAKRQGSLTVRSLDSLTRQPIPGVSFTVAYADGRPVENGRYTTNSDGAFSINGVSGAVVVTEVQTVNGYSMDPANVTRTVTVNPGETQTLDFFDIPNQSLTVQLYARGTTTPIAGARFLLTDGTGAELGNEDGEFATDENGRFTVQGIAPGVTVSVKQITTADGFLFDAAPRTVTIQSGEAQSVTVYNDPAQTLTVRLYEKGTTTPIPGAVFLLRDSGGTLVGAENGRFTTNASGEFTITGLVPGVTITATQTAAVSGFVIDTAPQSILIQSGEA
ncbi:MAG: hypothetical protein J6X53_09480, partial [Abditibacteriota bacterium]|nr:hypothetical protein [Abditibacteriota bacterium]